VPLAFVGMSCAEELGIALCAVAVGVVRYQFRPGGV
jgi:hypothetical protein